MATASNSLKLPSDITLKQLARLGMVEDKPILMDYWKDSLEKKVCIGVRQGTNPVERILAKSADEYTSSIAKLYKSGDEIIIITENSIYVVYKDIETKSIR
jgi:hypothetical protein